MSLRRLWAIMHKEFRHVQRDRRMLVLVTVSPAVMLLTFAYLFTFDNTTSRLAVYDGDRSPQSRALIQALATDTELVFSADASSADELRSFIVANKVKVGLIIPPGMGDDLVAGRQASVEVLGDGADPINSAAQMSRLSARLSTWSHTYLGTALVSPVSLHSLIWYNPDLKSSYSMVPPLLAIVLILPAMAVALAITREKELGSFESLAATPVRATEYVLGKLIPYIVYALFGAAIAVLVALFWFKVPFRGNYANLFAFTSIYLWATLGITVLLASFMKDQGTALRAVLILFLIPSFFLSGLLLPVPPDSRLVSGSLPATHFVTISRGIFLKGLGWAPLGNELFVLLAMGTITVGLTIISFRKRVG